MINLSKMSLPVIDHYNHIKYVHTPELCHTFKNYTRYVHFLNAGRVRAI